MLNDFRLTDGYLWKIIKTIKLYDDYMYFILSNNCFSKEFIFFFRSIRIYYHNLAFKRKDIYNNKELLKYLPRIVLLKLRDQQTSLEKIILREYDNNPIIESFGLYWLYIQVTKWILDGPKKAPQDY